MVKFYFISVFLLLTLSSLAQTKYEKEVRIKQNVVPQSALDFVDALSFSHKVKWYKEFGLESTSIEAKTKREGQRYSIEFNTAGELEDVEVQIKWESLPLGVRASIDDYLQGKFNKYRLRKIQVQYVGAPNDMIVFLKNENRIRVAQNYELVLSAKVDGAYKKFEFLFSGEGNFLKSAEIVSKNTDNIEY